MLNPSLLSDLGVKHASVAAQESLWISGNQSRLSSGISALDHFFDGGLPYGSVVEWGLPLGLGGHEIVLAFLAQAAQSQTTPSENPLNPKWILWSSGRPELTVYPPAWHARGVNLEYIRFAKSTKPVEDLKPLFLDPFFKIIVLDAPKDFSEDDCAFIARQARAHGQLILILRDFFLGPRRGNVWARYRVNCARLSSMHSRYGLPLHGGRQGGFPGENDTLEGASLPGRGLICLRSVRGLAARQILYDPDRQKNAYQKDVKENS